VTVHVTLVLGRETLRLPMLTWTKAAWLSGDAHFLLDVADGRVRAISDFSLAAGDLAVSGKAQFGKEDGSLARVDLDRLKLARTDLKGVTLAFTGGRADIVIRGGEVDAEPLIKRDDTRPPMAKPPFTLPA